MSASDRFDFSRKENTLQILEKITLPTLISKCNSRFVNYGEYVVNVLINMNIQDWRPDSNIGSGLYHFMGQVSIYNSIPISDYMLHSTINVSSYDDNHTTYIGRINYGKANDLTYANSKITWLQS